MIAQLNEIMKALAESRVLFHSEDDFKFEFALQLKNRFADYQVRLEKPLALSYEIRKDGEIQNIPGTAYFDIVAFSGNEFIPIELKYRTRHFTAKINEEEYALREHSARDVGRYSIRKDVYRIDKIVNGPQAGARKGYVILLTNDAYYWNQADTGKGLDRHYRIDQVIAQKDAGWEIDGKNMNPNKHWTKGKEYQYKLDLSSKYQVRWYDYVIKPEREGKNSQFRYGIIQVEKK